MDPMRRLTWCVSVLSSICISVLSAQAAVPPGNYCLFAWDDIPTDSHLNSEFLERFQSFAQPIRVDNGAAIDRVMRVIDRMN